MNFENELSKGNFIISYCKKCKSNIWPPNEICSNCFGKAEWKKSSNEGHIIEYSQKNDKIFCLVELDVGVKVIGSLSHKDTPQIGQKITLKECSINDGKYHFEMNLC